MTEETERERVRDPSYMYLRFVPCGPCPALPCCVVLCKLCKAMPCPACLPARLKQQSLFFPPLPSLKGRLRLLNMPLCRSSIHVQLAPSPPNFPVSVLAYLAINSKQPSFPHPTDPTSQKLPIATPLIYRRVRRLLTNPPTSSHARVRYGRRLLRSHWSTVEQLGQTTLYTYAAVGAGIVKEKRQLLAKKR